MLTGCLSTVYRSPIATHTVLRPGLFTTPCETKCSRPFATAAQRSTAARSRFRQAQFGSSLVSTQVQSDDAKVLDQHTNRLRTFLGLARAVRSLGAPALALAYVACGRLDAFFEDHKSVGYSCRNAPGRGGWRLSPYLQGNSAR
jgi:hypothetical protein